MEMRPKLPEWKIVEDLLINFTISISHYLLALPAPLSTKRYRIAVVCVCEMRLISSGFVRSNTRAIQLQSAPNKSLCLNHMHLHTNLSEVCITNKRRIKSFRLGFVAGAIMNLWQLIIG